MKASERVFCIVSILASIMVLCFIAIESHDWYRTKVLVHEAVYEYVPASQAKIIACWVGSAILSILIGFFVGLGVYSVIKEEE